MLERTEQARDDDNGYQRHQRMAEAPFDDFMGENKAISIAGSLGQRT